ncbi:MAG: ATP-binding protein [Candidatus Erginobacter occultus]|nr:ATP-binding protein [Candidatus Erginobacter occultus]
MAFRLTLWYAAIFLLVSAGVFSSIYFLVQAYLVERIDRWLEAEAQESAAMLSQVSLEELKEDISAEESAIGEDKVFFRLVTAEGREIAVSDLSVWSNFSLAETMSGRVNDSVPAFQTVLFPGDRHKTRIVQVFIAPGVIFQMGQNMKAEDGFMARLKFIFAYVGFGAVLLSFSTGWFMARRALSGVEEVTQAARLISDSTLDRRVPLKGTDDEIDRLASTFNSMLERIQSLITGIKEINDNIAHELRSPITRIRGSAEMSLSLESSAEELKSVVAGTVEGCDQLLSLINTMLDISEMESGIRNLNCSVIDISEVVNRGVEIFQPVAEENGIGLSVQTPISVQIRGDTRKLQRALANLVDNALKHTPAGGCVSVSLKEKGGEVSISVRDTGTGIPLAQLPHVFKRFYRSENENGSGSGLGLSLARAIVRFHEGEITVESVPGEGSTFTIVLPSVG